MAKRKIDNLTESSTASEMEQAILELEQEKTNLPTEPVEAKEEKPIEKTEDNSEEKVVEEPKEEQKEVAKEPPKEVVIEDEFGGDYTKLKKSYKEAYSWNTRMAQELSTIKREMEALKTSAQPKQSEEPTITQEQFNEWYERDPISANRFLARLEASEQTKTLERELSSVKQNLTGILAQNAVGAFRNKYQDFSALEDDIREEINNLPKEYLTNPEYFSRALETGYWTVKGRKSAELAEAAREEGRKEVQKKTQAKKDSYVEGSTKPVVEKAINTENMSSDELFEIMKAKGLVHL